MISCKYVELVRIIRNRLVYGLDKTEIINDLVDRGYDRDMIYFAYHGAIIMNKDN